MAMTDRLTAQLMKLNALPPMTMDGTFATAERNLAKALARTTTTAAHPFKRMGTRDWCEVCWEQEDNKLHLVPVPKFRSVEEADAWLDAQAEKVDDSTQLMNLMAKAVGTVGSGKSAITSSGNLTAKTLNDAIDKVRHYSF